MGALFSSQGSRGACKLPESHPVKAIVVSVFIISGTKTLHWNYSSEISAFTHFLPEEKTFLLYCNLKFSTYFFMSVFKHKNL